MYILLRYEKTDRVEPIISTCLGICLLFFVVSCLLIVVNDIPYGTTLIGMYCQIRDQLRCEHTAIMYLLS